MLAVLVSPVSSQQSERAPEYEGTWASNNGDYGTTRNAVFVSITRLGNENRYFVISVSNSSSVFTYVGGGQVRDDGFLQVSTDTGAVWVFAPAHSAGHPESISISNLANVDSFGVYIRVERKFREWPFPAGNNDK